MNLKIKGHTQYWLFRRVGLVVLQSCETSGSRSPKEHRDTDVPYGEFSLLVCNLVMAELPAFLGVRGVTVTTGTLAGHCGWSWWDGLSGWAGEPDVLFKGFSFFFQFRLKSSTNTTTMMTSSRRARRGKRMIIEFEEEPVWETDSTFTGVLFMG